MKADGTTTEVRKSWWQSLTKDTSFCLSQEDAQFRNKWRRRINGNWLTQVKNGLKWLHG